MFITVSLLLEEVRNAWNGVWTSEIDASEVNYNLQPNLLWPCLSTMGQVGANVLYKGLIMQHRGVKIHMILGAWGPGLENCPLYWLFDLKLLQAWYWWWPLLVYHQGEGKDVWACVHTWWCVYTCKLVKCTQKTVAFIFTGSYHCREPNSRVRNWKVTHNSCPVMSRCFVLLKTNILKPTSQLVSNTGCFNRLKNWGDIE